MRPDLAEVIILFLDFCRFFRADMLCAPHVAALRAFRWRNARRPVARRCRSTWTKRACNLRACHVVCRPKGVCSPKSTSASKMSTLGLG